MSVVELAKALMACPSVTPEEGGCHALLMARLEKLGFKIESLPFGKVDNFWARKGTEAPLVVFAGHTDVVPPGPLAAWTSPPFEPEERDGYLFGRGAVDMKGGVAAQIIAVEHFLALNPHHKGSIGFLITSDEEGASTEGTKKVIEVLEERQEKIDYCLIAEPSSETLLGDQIRVGRRGSLHGKLIIHGRQGHIAYPVEGQNPIHNCFKALKELCTIRWDKGNEYFPPTSFQISNIHAGTGALNVTPGLVELQFNFRFSTALTAMELQERVRALLSAEGLRFDLEWTLSGQPFLTKQGKLIQAACDAVHELLQRKPQLSTGGGTSDGRFIAPTGAEVIELGLCHASAHQVDEAVKVSDLEALPAVYERVLEKLLLLS